MDPISKQLLDAILELSEEDRLEIFEVLAASLQPVDQPPFNESWREVIQRRSMELRDGKVAPVSWEEVKRRARKRAGI